MPFAGPWRRKWRSESTRATCSPTTILTSSTTSTSTLSQHQAAGGPGENLRRQPQRHTNFRRCQRGQPRAAPQLTASISHSSHLSQCTRHSNSLHSTARQRVLSQRGPQRAYHRQTHATSQLHRARTAHVSLIAVVCMIGYCICMLVCGMSCHMSA